VALIVLHGVDSTTFHVDTTTVALAAMIVVLALVPLLESATLPGGGGLVFRKQLNALESAVSELEAGSDGSLAEPRDASRDGHEHGAAAIPAVQALEDVVDQVLREAARSPKIGLMLLSAELERAVRRLLMASGWGAGRPRAALREGVQRLVEIGVLSRSAASTLDLFTQVRAAVVHGSRQPTDDEILRALDSGIQLYSAVAVIPRERHFVWAAGVELFSDEGCTVQTVDATGVILRSVAEPRNVESKRIFPTTLSFQTGDEVAWMWNTSKQWGPTWYRSLDTSEPVKAWDGSVEFVGRPLDDL
jgi:hypothetical protein